MSYKLTPIASQTALPASWPGKDGETGCGANVLNGTRMFVHDEKGQAHWLEVIWDDKMLTDWYETAWRLDPVNRPDNDTFAVYLDAMSDDDALDAQEVLDKLHVSHLVDQIDKVEFDGMQQAIDERNWVMWWEYASFEYIAELTGDAHWNYEGHEWLL